MNQELKQRLVGATVLIILGIILLPMMLDKPVSNGAEPEITNIQLTSRSGEKSSTDTGRTIPSEVLARYEQSDLKLQQPNSEPRAQTAPEQKREPVTKPAPKPQVQPKPQQRPKPSAAVVKKPTVKSTGKVTWAVQMGSFSSKDNANRLVQRMKVQKIPAYFEKVESNGKEVFRVRVGPLKTKLSAESMKQNLDKKERLKTLIVTLQ